MRRPGRKAYRLDDQIGFILRQVAQRHAVLFAAGLGPELTPTQWAALAKLHEVGPLSQNLLGRQTAMDGATIKGVVDRLAVRGLVKTEPDAEDARRLTVELTGDGASLVEKLVPRAMRVTDETLAPLHGQERDALLLLLQRLR